VHQGDVVIGTDDVAEGGEALLNPLNLDGIWDRIAQVLQFLVGG